MNDCFEIDGIKICLIKKNVKSLSLRVKPPHGVVDLTVPESVSFEAARAFVISRLSWIRKQRDVLDAQARLPTRRFVERESHFVWGKRCILELEEEQNSKPSLMLEHTRLKLRVKPGCTLADRRRVMEKWRREQLREVVPEIVRKWESRLNVSVSAYFIQRMKTKWGSCNTTERSIRLNLELTQRPKEIVEYVIVHEMMHLIEPSHGRRFIEMMDSHLPSWKTLRDELNSLPLPDEMWAEKNVIADVADENGRAGL
jgi:predicted metal-dependent hydrolase